MSVIRKEAWLLFLAVDYFELVLDFSRSLKHNSVKGTLVPLPSAEPLVLSYISLLICNPSEEVTLKRLAEYGSLFLDDTTLFRAKTIPQIPETIAAYQATQIYPFPKNRKREIDVRGWRDEGAEYNLNVILGRIEFPEYLSRRDGAAIRTICHLAHVVGQHMAKAEQLRKQLGLGNGRILRVRKTLAGLFGSG